MTHAADFDRHRHRFQGLKYGVSGAIAGMFPAAGRIWGKRSRKISPDIREMFTF